MNTNEIPTPITDAEEARSFKGLCNIRLAFDFARRLERQLASMTASEHELGQAYLRIRELVGAWNTDLGGENRFEVTEAAVEHALKRAARLTDTERSLTKSRALSVDLVKQLLEVTEQRDGLRDALKACREDSICQHQRMIDMKYTVAAHQCEENIRRADEILESLKP